MGSHSTLRHDTSRQIKLLSNNVYTGIQNSVTMNRVIMKLLDQYVHTPEPHYNNIHYTVNVLKFRTHYSINFCLNFVFLCF